MTQLLKGGKLSPKFRQDTIEYDRNFRSEFISDQDTLLDFISEIGSHLSYDQFFGQLSDRILFPIGFPIGFLSTFRSDPMVFLVKISDRESYRNFGLENLGYTVELTRYKEQL